MLLHWLCHDLLEVYRKNILDFLKPFLRPSKDIKGYIYGNTMALFQMEHFMCTCELLRLTETLFYSDLLIFWAW